MLPALAVTHYDWTFSFIYGRMAYFVLILKGFALVVIYFAEIYSQYPIKNPLNLVQSKYMADVGFSIRGKCLWGGAILSSEAMAIMGKLGIKLYFSEYGE